MPRKSPKLLSREQDTLLRSELLRLAAELQPITVRGLYYQAVVSATLDFITKDSLGSTTNYDLIQRRVLDLRKAGEMPWDWVVDESRSSYGVNRWDNPAGFAETAPWFYRLDFWREQSVRPLVTGREGWSDPRLPAARPRPRHRRCCLQGLRLRQLPPSGGALDR